MNEVLSTLKKAAAYIAAVFLLGALLGWLLNARCNPPPEIRPGVPDTSLTVTLPPPDTSAPRVMIRYRPEYVRDTDTVYVDTSKKALPDSSPCWTIDTTVKKIGVHLELQSRELPPVEPRDLRRLLIVTPAPESTIVVTVPKIIVYHKPIYADWRNYALIALAGVLTWRTFGRNEPR